MKNLNSKLLIILFTLVLIIISTACSEEDSLLLSDSNTLSDKEALEKIVDEDESIQSFDVNYDEEEAMDFVLGKTAEEIYPVRVGQKMHLVQRNLELTFEGDEAFGTLTKTFEGVLFIVASSEPIDVPLDEIDLDVYEKSFSTVITRNLKFVKVNNTQDPRKNWKLDAISLPVGGTLDENIEIESVTIYLPEGESIIISDPLEYFLSRGPSFERLVPTLTQFETVGVEVNIKSIYPEVDYVTLTHGALRDRKNVRAKRRFAYVEDYMEYNGYYYRTYKGEWVVNQFKGFKHAVINAFPWGVIKDSVAPVETSSWGIPYIVN
jgi:hypothetical protein